MLTQYLVDQKQAMRGISLLYKAIRKIQLFDSQLTSIHADLCQLCLLAKCFKPAIEILDIDITAINQEVYTLYNGNNSIIYIYYIFRADKWMLNIFYYIIIMEE